MGFDVCFAECYCARPKTRENSGGPLRLFYPKGRNPFYISLKTFLRHLSLINAESPRKALSFRSAQDLQNPESGKLLRIS